MNRVNKLIDEYINCYCVTCTQFHGIEDCGKDDSTPFKTILICMKEGKYVSK